MAANRTRRIPLRAVRAASLKRKQGILEAGKQHEPPQHTSLEVFQRILQGIASL